MLRFRNYWIYSAGLAIAWAVVLLLTLAVGATERWVVPGDRLLELTPDAVFDNTVRFRLRLVRGNMAELNANIQAARGNPAVIGGPRFSEGVLIIIVWANAEPR